VDRITNILSSSPQPQPSSSQPTPQDSLFPQHLTEQKYRSNKANLAATFEREAAALSRRPPTPRLSTCLEPHEPIGDSLPSPVPDNPMGRPPLERQESNLSEASGLDARNSAVLDRRRTIASFMDAISDSGRKLSMIVHQNQTQALETLLADLQGRSLSPQRVMLYSLLTFLLLVTCYWLTAWLLQHLLALRDTLTSQLEHLSTSQTSQMDQLARRLEHMEGLLTGLGGQADTASQLEQVMAQLREGMEGNALKVTVMDRLVGELAGIEAALAGLQQQVSEGQGCSSWSALGLMAEEDGH